MPKSLMEWALEFPVGTRVKAIRACDSFVHTWISETQVTVIDTKPLGKKDPRRMRTIHPDRLIKVNR